MTAMAEFLPDDHFPPVSPKSRLAANRLPYVIKQIGVELGNMTFQLADIARVAVMLARNLPRSASQWGCRDDLVVGLIGRPELKRRLSIAGPGMT
jgi:hypothetical protein